MKDEMKTLPCGCQMGRRWTPLGYAFVYKPCSPNCVYYKFAMEEAKKTHGSRVLGLTNDGIKPIDEATKQYEEEQKRKQGNCFIDTSVI